MAALRKAFKRLIEVFLDLRKFHLHNWVYSQIREERWCFHMRCSRKERWDEKAQRWVPFK